MSRDWNKHPWSFMTQNGTRQGTYVGPDERLKGKTALLKDDPQVETVVRAQFDDRSLQEAYGWHAFQRAHFEIAPKTEGTSCQ